MNENDLLRAEIQRLKTESLTDYVEHVTSADSSVFTDGAMLVKLPVSLNGGKKWIWVVWQFCGDNDLGVHVDGKDVLSVRTVADTPEGLIELSN
jgi:hypothetical protein